MDYMAATQSLQAIIKQMREHPAITGNLTDYENADKERVGYYVRELAQETLSMLCDSLDALHNIEAAISYIDDVPDPFANSFGLLSITEKAEQYLAKTSDLIPLAQYAVLNGVLPDTARQKAGRGGFKTAVKIGRDWMISRSEQYSDNRTTGGKMRQRGAGNE